MEVILNRLNKLMNYLFIDTYKSSKIQIGMNKMMVNDSEMCVR